MLPDCVFIGDLKERLKETQDKLDVLGKDLTSVREELVAEKLISTEEKRKLTGELTALRQELDKQKRC